MSPLIYWTRAVCSCLFAGIVTVGTAMQAVMQDGTLPTRMHILTALLGGGIVMAKDLASRLAPPGPSQE